MLSSALRNLHKVKNVFLKKKLLGRYAVHRYSSDQSTRSVLELLNTDNCCSPAHRGLVVGYYADNEDKKDTGILTKLGAHYSKCKTNNRLFEVIQLSGPAVKIGEARLFFALEDEKLPYYSVVAVVGLGKECMGYCTHEVQDLQKEVIRRSVAQGCRKLQDINVLRIDVDACDHAESAAEGAALGIWAYQELKNPSDCLAIPLVDMYFQKGSECDFEGWKIGIEKAAAQNLTRQLQETPANLLTPTVFAQNVVEILCKSGINVEVKVEGWAQTQNMNAFLAVGRASCETPIFLEMSYFGTCAEESPIVLVGQGITYNCGGLSMKKAEDLTLMRGDMTGAACVVATMRAIANMKLPINIRGLVPLCENIIGCNSFRPGDTVKCMNGKTIEIEECNNGNVLLLADALIYAQNFGPKYIVDIGTTTSYMADALCEAAAGIFTNSEMLWQAILNASMHTGDRVWRFPLWDFYTHAMKQMKNQQSDTTNRGLDVYSSRPCTAAALLREFVPCGQWMHIDATNIMTTNGLNFEYIREGMAGRPTRTLVEFIAQTICYKQYDSKP